jgi:DNA recombination protein RmuC
MDILYFILLLVAIIIGFVILYLVLKPQLDNIERKQSQNILVEELSPLLNNMDGRNQKSFEQLQKDIVELREASKNMMKVGETISSLEDLLKPPKLRGGMGETLLAELLRQILPPGTYELQHTFRSGERVDAAIHIGDHIVPVDAKFPLEEFRRLKESDDEKITRNERKAFIATVKRHIDDISRKYILPDESTFDFALMYIPAENVYYESIIKDNDEGIFPYAVAKKVVPVSPNSFYSYLNVIIQGMRGMHIEERAKLIMAHLDRLKGDEKRVRNEFDTLGTHLTNARNKYDEVTKLMNRFEDKLLSEGSDIEIASSDQETLKLKG